MDNRLSKIIVIMIAIDCHWSKGNMVISRIYFDQSSILSNTIELIVVASLFHECFF